MNEPILLKILKHIPKAVHKAAMITFMGDLMANLKPFCGGTQTSAAFFGWIRSALRRLSVRWKPKNEYLLTVRRPYTGAGKRSKWEYQCQICFKWHIRAHIEVDHKERCGKLKDFNDLGDFCKKLFCEKEGFQALCKECHIKKTNEEKHRG
jgi:hypothetical protein